MGKFQKIIKYLIFVKIKSKDFFFAKKKITNVLKNSKFRSFHPFTNFPKELFT